MEFVKGLASGVRFGLNNCLIHTLQQALDSVLGPVLVDIPWVRKELKVRFPRTQPPNVATVTDANFLDLGEHWKAVIDLLGVSARNHGCDLQNQIHHRFFQIHCVDERTKTLGSCEGDGAVKLYILNEGGNHFVPLIRRWFGSR